MFKQEVHAKYKVVEVQAIDFDKIKSFAKKAIIPLFLALGPVACGTQEKGDIGVKDTGVTTPAEQSRDIKTVETKMNKNLVSQGIKCKITIKDDSSFWTFIDDEGSSVVLKVDYTDDGQLNKDSVEVTKDPSGDKMTNFTDAVMTTFKDFGGDHVGDKYGCSIQKTVKKLPPTSPQGL